MKTEIALKYLSKAILIACLASSTVYAADVKQSSLATKTIPVTGDKALIIDSADGNKSKNVTLGSLPLSTATNTALGLKANALGADDNYVTDAEKIKLGNLSGTNTGDQNAAGVSVADAGGYYTGTTVETILQEIGLAGFGGSVDLSAYLSKTNTTAFTPSGDYHPATKKYVDDSITAGGGYTDEQAQDAAGGMFSGNTETGITVTYNDTTGKVDFVVATQSDVNFTSTLSTKLTGIATGAEVNVNADWNSSSGDSQILNKPTIPTISDSAYGSGWNGDTGAASKNAIYDKIETIAGGSMTYPSANNFGWTTNGTSWTSMGLDADISSVSASDDTVPSAKATKAALDLKANASSIAFEAATWADLKILDTTHTTAGTGIAIVQDSMAYANADDAYHLWSIDKIGSELAGKQASDADLTDLADGSLTGSKVGFADTDGLWTASNIEAALVEMNDSINTGAPNGTGAKVHWSQLLGVPAGFADGSDDGTGGGITHAASDGTYYASRNGAWSSFTSGNYTIAMTLTANTAVTLPTSGTLIASGGAIGAATATTPSANDNDTSVATTAYVQTEITATASDTLTLTNKTLDTAGTGNSITVPLNGVLDGAITDPADADDMIFKKVQNAMTLTGIHCLAEGGGTITLTLQECTAAGASCANIETAITCDADGAEDDGTLSDGAIAAGAWIKVLYSAPTGTVNNVAWTVYGTQTW